MLCNLGRLRSRDHGCRAHPSLVAVAVWARLGERTLASPSQVPRSAIWGRREAMCRSVTCRQHGEKAKEQTHESGTHLA